MDKETLQRYQHNRKEIVQIREEIETLRAKLESPGTQKITGMPTAHGGSGDPLGSGIAALDALREKYEKKLCDLCAEQAEIETALDMLDGEARAILRYRYISGYKWETICNLMGADEYNPMDWTTVHRKHRKALRKLQELPKA